MLKLQNNWQCLRINEQQLQITKHYNITVEDFAEIKKRIETVIPKKNFLIVSVVGERRNKWQFIALLPYNEYYDKVDDVCTKIDECLTNKQY